MIKKYNFWYRLNKFEVYKSEDFEWYRLQFDNNCTIYQTLPNVDDEHNTLFKQSRLYSPPCTHSLSHYFLYFSPSYQPVAFYYTVSNKWIA